MTAKLLSKSQHTSACNPNIPLTMKAVVLQSPTQGHNVALTEVPVPKVRPGWVLIKVKAFGMNHSEQILRLSEINADYIQKPIIPGIECVGEIADPSDSNLQPGQKVAALMGGTGRSFNGSYAQYVLAPISHVFAIQSDLSWEKLAAIPETYFTAWGSLFQGLKLEPSDTLLIRGATCALGYASLQIAKAIGCKVIATTHRKSKISLLAQADQAILDTGNLTSTVSKKFESISDPKSSFKPAVTLAGPTKALDLVGPKTLQDTLKCVEFGGIVCNTGVLGGIYTINGFDPIKAIPNGVYLTGFYSNKPDKNTMDEIFRFIESNHLNPPIGKVFDFRQIEEACVAQDSGQINGKIIVKVSD